MKQLTKSEFETRKRDYLEQQGADTCVELYDYTMYRATIEQPDYDRYDVLFKSLKTISDDELGWLYEFKHCDDHDCDDVAWHGHEEAHGRLLSTAEQKEISKEKVAIHQEAYKRALIEDILDFWSENCEKFDPSSLRSSPPTAPKLNK